MNIKIVVKQIVYEVTEGANQNTLSQKIQKLDLK